jgi:hypothetical protein
MMKETNGEGPNAWKRPLKGWRWLAAWVLLVACLSALIWTVLSFTSDKMYVTTTALPWFPSIGIALTVAILFVLLVSFLSSWRNIKRMLLGLACLIGLIALFYGEEDIRGWLAWRHFKAQWAATGEKFDLAAVVPPPVPDDQNFAMAPVVATTYSRVLDRNGHPMFPQNTNVVELLQMPLDVANGGPAHAVGNWQKAVGSDLEPWQLYYRNLSLTNKLFPVAPKPQTPAADVLLALSRYETTIEELRRAAALPASRFPLNYDRDQPFAILLPHLAPLKGCAVVLQLRALAELQVGQGQAALADISLALSLTEKIRSEPFLISHLVRIAIFQITQQAIWEGMANHHWTDAQLSELDRQLASFDFISDYLAAMRGENACQVAGMESLRHRADPLDCIGESSGNDSFRLANLPGYLIPSGWYHQNELRSSQFILEQFLPVAQLDRQAFSPSLVSQANQSLNAMRLTPYTMLCKMLLPGLTKCAHKFAFSQASLNLARTACALERYRLAMGKYPETLDVLAPKFISKVPTDPIGDNPLHYRSTEGGYFVLYSIGWNQADDNGRVRVSKSGSVDLDNGDWVWRYPGYP